MAYEFGFSMRENPAFHSTAGIGFGMSAGIQFEKDQLRTV
jgi:hypothetical protein